MSFLSDSTMVTPSPYASLLHLPLSFYILDSSFISTALPTRAKMKHADFALSPFCFLLLSQVLLQRPLPNLSPSCAAACKYSGEQIFFDHWEFTGRARSVLVNIAVFVLLEVLLQFIVASFIEKNELLLHSACLSCSALYVIN